MNEADKKEIKAALVQVVTRLLLALAVVVGAVDYAIVAPYLNDILRQAQANAALLSGECR